MTPRLFLLEPPHPGDDWAPWAGVRPIAELRAGVFRIGDRWKQFLGLDEVLVMSPATPRFADVGSFPLAPGAVVGPAVVARSNFAPIGRPMPIPTGTKALAVQGHAVAWMLGPGEPWEGPADVPDALEVKALRLNGASDLVTACERLIEDDCAALAAEDGSGVPAGAIVIGDPALVVVRTASVEPQVVFDVRKGPIILEPDSVVRAGSRLEGPLYLGPHSWLLGGSVRQSVIGPHCRVHGEMTSTVMIGYANKSHDGFVGHTIIGQWANLGAGTITSNLKNTYGPIRLDLPNGRIETGRNNLGSLVGDHAKTGIGTLLSTGTVVGAGANVIGPSIPRAVRPFTWDGIETLTLGGFLTIARRVMPRRGVDVTPEIEASLAALHGRLAR
ncbi:MAG: hypothetical protein AB7L66_13635 [Gemmatimonadales bacterium]